MERHINASSLRISDISGSGKEVELRLPVDNTQRYGQWPRQSGIVVLSVNNIFADEFGNVNVPTGIDGGGGTYVVQNALTEEMPNVFELGSITNSGSPLLHNTFINGATFDFEVNADNSYGRVNVAQINPTESKLRADWVFGSGEGYSWLTAHKDGYAEMYSREIKAGILYSDASLLVYPNRTVLTSTYPDSDNDTVVPVSEIVRKSTGSALSGIGARTDYLIQTTDGTNQISNQVITQWEDATTASRRSKYIITGVNNAVTADLFTLKGTGQTQLNKYGIGSFTAGTPTYNIVVDASGNLMEGTLVSVVSITADNGLTINPADNVQLGSTAVSGAPLLHETYIGGIAGIYGLHVTSAMPGGYATFYALNTAGGAGIYSEAQGIGNGVEGISLNGLGGFFKSTGNAGLQAHSTNSIPIIASNAHTSNSTVVTMLQLQRQVTGSSGSDGIGLSIDFNPEASDGNVWGTNSIISRWVEANLATRKSELSITGIHNGTLARHVAIASTGLLTFDGYAGALLTGTPTYLLGTDAAGTVYKTALAGVGGTGIIRIECKIGDTYVVTPTGATTISGLTDTSTSMTSAAFANAIVNVYRGGGTLLPGIDPGDATWWVDKTYAGTTATFNNGALTTDEIITIMIIPT